MEVKLQEFPFFIVEDFLKEMGRTLQDLLRIGCLFQNRQRMVSIEWKANLTQDMLKMKPVKTANGGIYKRKSAIAMAMLAVVGRADGRMVSDGNQRRKNKDCNRKLFQFRM